MIAIIIFLFGISIIFKEHHKQVSAFFNGWITDQEQKELRAIELELLAADKRLPFLEENVEFEKEMWGVLDHITSPPQKFKHFMIGEEANGRFMLHDYDSIKSQSKRMSATSVQFDFQTVPSFVLVHKSVQRIHVLNSEFSRSNGTFNSLEDSYFPGWLFPTEFKCFYQGSNPYEVSEFLEQNRPFSFVTNESSVRIICFNKSYVCAFYERILEPDGSNFMQFKRLALRMLELQGDESEPTEKGPNLG